MKGLDFSPLVSSQSVTARARSFVWKVGLTIFAGVLAIGAGTWQTRADTNIWAGLSAETLNWSAPVNWSLNAVPTVNDTVVFGDAGGFTNAQGVVNNIVDSSITISNLVYSGRSNSVVLYNDFHTTQINSGVTLSVAGTNQNLFFTGGLGANGFNPDDYVFANVVGGGTLAVGDLVGPRVNTEMSVVVRTATAITQLDRRAVLDMSGLDTFTFGGGRLLVGVGSNTPNDRPAGELLLAKTNIITATAAVASPGSFVVGYTPNGNASPFGGLVQLGQDNTINTDYLRVGAAKQIGTMRFRSGLANPTLKLRGKDGVSPMSNLHVGDNAENTTGSPNSIGNLDLTGGSVDALISTLIIGRNPSAAAAAGGGIGTLTFTAGSIVATGLVRVGVQAVNTTASTGPKGTVTGTLNVLSNATFMANSLFLGGDAGNGPGTGEGILNISDGGQVIITNDLVENQVYFVASTTNIGFSTINLTNGTLNVGGRLVVDTLNIVDSTVANFTFLGLRTNNFGGINTGLTLVQGQTLAPANTNITGALVVNGDLTLNNATLALDLSSPTNFDSITVANTLTLSGTNFVNIGVTGVILPGSYTLASATTLIGNASNLQLVGLQSTTRYQFSFSVVDSTNLVLTVGLPPTNIVWSGDGLANVWDVNGATNWNSQTEKFYNLDSVTFTDAGSMTPAIYLAGTLLPGGTTVNSANNYTFTGTGSISSNGLTKLGSGTLTIQNNNSYTGATLVGGGTLLVNGSLGNTSVIVSNVARFGGSGSVSGSVTNNGVLLPGGSGIGALTLGSNLVTTGTVEFQANLNTPANSSVSVANKVTFGGTLSLVLNGRAPVATDTFKLFTAATYEGAFTSIFPSSPGAGLTWNTSTLTTDGTLRILSNVNTAPAPVSFVVNGNQIDLSWPADRTGWRLEAQTNSVQVGLSSNWVTVTGSHTNNHFTVPINPTNGSVFYRLVYP